MEHLLRQKRKPNSTYTNQSFVANISKWFFFHHSLNWMNDIFWSGVKVDGKHKLPFMLSSHVNFSIHNLKWLCWMAEVFRGAHLNDDSKPRIHHLQLFNVRQNPFYSRTIRYIFLHSFERLTALRIRLTIPSHECINVWLNPCENSDFRRTRHNINTVINSL